MKAKDFLKEMDDEQKSFFRLAGILYDLDQEIENLINYHKMSYSSKPLSFPQAEVLQKLIIKFMPDQNDSDVLKVKEQYRFLENFKNNL